MVFSFGTGFVVQEGDDLGPVANRGLGAALLPMGHREETHPDALADLPLEEPQLEPPLLEMIPEGPRNAGGFAPWRVKRPNG